MSDKNVKAEEKKQEVEKQINPAKDKGNYVVQIMNDGQILKQVMALNSTVNIVYVGQQALAAEIK